MSINKKTSMVGVAALALAMVFGSGCKTTNSLDVLKSPKGKEESSEVVKEARDHIETLVKKCNKAIADGKMEEYITGDGIPDIMASTDDVDCSCSPITSDGEVSCSVSSENNPQISVILDSNGEMNIDSTKYAGANEDTHIDPSAKGFSLSGKNVPTNTKELSKGSRDYECTISSDHGENKRPLPVEHCKGLVGLIRSKVGSMYSKIYSKYLDYCKKQDDGCYGLKLKEL